MTDAQNEQVDAKKEGEQREKTLDLLAGVRVELDKVLRPDFSGMHQHVASMLQVAGRSQTNDLQRTLHALKVDPPQIQWPKVEFPSLTLDTTLFQKIIEGWRSYVREELPEFNAFWARRGWAVGPLVRNLPRSLPRNLAGHSEEDVEQFFVDAFDQQFDRLVAATIADLKALELPSEADRISYFEEAAEYYRAKPDTALIPPLLYSQAEGIGLVVLARNGSEDLKVSKLDFIFARGEGRAKIRRAAMASHIASDEARPEAMATLLLNTWAEGVEMLIEYLSGKSSEAYVTRNLVLHGGVDFHQRKEVVRSFLLYMELVKVLNKRHL